MSGTKLELPWWVHIVIVVCVVAGTIALESLLLEFKLRNILLAILFVSLSSFVGAIVAKLTAGRQLVAATQELDQKFDETKVQIGQFKTEIDRVLSNSLTCERCIQSLNLSINTVKQLMEGEFRESLITYEDLVRIERSVRERSEIWVLTSSLVLENEELKETLQENFKKGIKYKYLIPCEDKRLQNRMMELASEWKRSSGLSVQQAKEQIQCFLVPEYLVYMTVIIYDAYGEPPTVLVKFPTSQLYEKAKYPLVYKVDSKPKDAWAIFVKSLQSMMDERGTHVVTKQLQFDFNKREGTSTQG